MAARVQAPRVWVTPSTRLHTTGRARCVRVCTAASSDLLVVGPGVLGSQVGSKWLQAKPGARVVGQTNTDRSHSALKQLGIEARTKDQATDEQFANVIFCAPPSGSDDYQAEIKAAAQLWSQEGTLLFTSSSAVYTDQQGLLYTEDSPTVAPGNPRVDRLLNAEAAVMDAGGSIVRLAGLYTSQRGAHTYYLKAGSVAVRPDGLLNLIHYEDAASLCVAALASGENSKIWMGCDNHPITKAELMQALYDSQKYGDGKKVDFTTTEGALGRRMNNDATRAALGWQPKYSSWAAFMRLYAAGEVQEAATPEGRPHQ